MRRSNVFFPCGDILLEGAWHFPDSDSPYPAVIVCHPYPPMGGNMNSNVVYAVCQSLAKNNIAAFRFNFRGVGKSGGHFEDGIGEQDDIKAALSFISISPYIDKERIGLAGYSFGGRMSLLVAERDSRVKMLALISPALTDVHWKQVQQFSRPKFLIVGEQDEAKLLPELVGWVKEAKSEHYQVVPGADHFWDGYENEVTDKVTEFFVRGLKPSSA